MFSHANIDICQWHYDVIAPVHDIISNYSEHKCAINGCLVDAVMVVQISFEIPDKMTPKHKHVLDVNSIEYAETSGDGVNIHVGCTKCSALAFKTLYAEELDWECGSCGGELVEGEDCSCAEKDLG